MSDQLENIMVQLGTGRWNILHIITVGFGAAIPTPHGLASAFFSPKIDYTCRSPPAAAAALDLGRNETSLTCSYLVGDPVTGELEEEPCTEWDFDNSTFSSTVTSEYQLVCGREYLRAIYQSMYMFGVFMGSPINGFLADRYGRKPLVVCGSLMFTTIAICSVFLTNFSALLAARFLVGLGHSTLLKTAYILGKTMRIMYMIAHILGKNKGDVRPISWLPAGQPQVRSAVAWPSSCPQSFNTVIFSGVAYLIRDWRTLQLIMSLLGILHIPGLWLMDESPRWLAVRGQHQRALSILKRAARWNKVTLPPDEELIAILKAGKDEVATSRASLHKAVSTRIKEALISLAILFR
ncbi:solute carrier family 22 member 6-B-like [Penaeus japonicus]|uniref:solute carrier family 22 member 6-B-like n=1 Tax=Penaeus japonicus TaxID=27405 RepID=UPI001C715BB9|nr:solute carrier family 22 member 6-B-like [Penaeus japonicus]